MDYGIVIVKKTISGHEYEYAFICDCWAGTGRKESYPSIKNVDNVSWYKDFS